MSEAADIQKEIASASAMCDELGKLLTKAPYVPQTRSDTIGNLVKALAAAQAEYKTIKKGTENPVYSTEKRKAMYAELCDVIAATQPALNKHGLVVIQSTSTSIERKTVTVETTLFHESGEWKSSHLEIPATQRNKRWNEDLKKNEYYERFDGQTIGAATTYGRRYDYSSMVGVASEPDDDANSLLEPGSKEAAQDVAKAKIAELQARTATQDPSKPPTPSQPSALRPSVPEPHSGASRASLESIGDIVKGFLRRKGVHEKLTKGKQKYLSVDVALEDGSELTMQCFDNKEFPDNSTTFGLLEMAAELTQPVPVRFRVKRNGKYVNIVQPELIFKTEFDESGVPIIQRDEPPPITDADLPESMFEEAQ